MTEAHEPDQCLHVLMIICMYNTAIVLVSFCVVVGWHRHNKNDKCSPDTIILHYADHLICKRKIKYGTNQSISRNQRSGNVKRFGGDGAAAAAAAEKAAFPYSSDVMSVHDAASQTNLTQHKIYLLVW